VIAIAFLSTDRGEQVTCSYHFVSYWLQNVEGLTVKRDVGRQELPIEKQRLRYQTWLADSRALPEY
jgi:hypothetical protein